jgi:putative tryptophan/tyrosine transport system substrate-binding protein
MRRRAVIAGLGGALVVGRSGAVRAQTAKRFRIGMLRGGSSAAQTEQFKNRLAELGHTEGRDYVLDIRAHEGRIERLPDLAASLVQSGTDLIVASGPEAALKAASSVTRSIPIVFVAVDYDPVALGYVAGLPRPGGNITGVFLRQVELTAKRLDFLKEAIPAVTDMAVFADAFTTDRSGQMEAAEAAAARLGVRLLPVSLPGAPPFDFAAALESSRERGAGAVLALMSPALFFDRERLIQALTAGRMPASFGLREFAELGGLMSYGANLVEMYGRAADYADKIMKGAKPGDLPVEQPTKFELVVNLKVAQALGLTIPPTLLARADEVIE